MTSRGCKHLVNVGAHIGSLCIPLSADVDYVTAIEPRPDTYAHLLRNIHLNALGSIRAVHAAIGDREEDMCLMGANNRRVINNSGGTHVFTASDIGAGRRSAHLADTTATVHGTSIDRMGGVDDVDALVIDVEGMESEVLRGAQETIRRQMPLIAVEIWSDRKRRKENMVSKRADIIEYIEQLGYTLVWEAGDDFIFVPANSESPR
jgi:FkbM family methyltransferase